jgi:hypothetical protein
MDLKRLMSALIGLFIVCAGFLFASPAQAAYVPWGWDGSKWIVSNVYNTHLVTKGYFQPDGEIFGAADTYGDSLAAVTQWKIGSSSTIHSLWNKNGSGSPWVTYNGDIAEGTKVLIRSCNGATGSGFVMNCSPWYTATA